MMMYRYETDILVSFNSGGRSFFCLCFSEFQCVKLNHAPYSEEISDSDSHWNQKMQLHGNNTEKMGLGQSEELQCLGVRRSQFTAHSGTYIPAAYRV